MNIQLLIQTSQPHNMQKIQYKLFQKPQKHTFWDHAINAITRPPKIAYVVNNDTKIIKDGKVFQKYNKNVQHFNQTIQVTIFLPINKNKSNLNLILYCHCNASNRLQCMQYLDKLPQNYAIASFDFLGCGNTQQYYLSLGFRQSKQIESVFNQLQNDFKNIILWGRSMGAASVIKYGKGLINICDSPFSSLKKLTKQSAYKIPKIPNCIICCLFPCIYCKLRSDIQKRAQFDIQQLDLIECVKNMKQNQAILFIVSKNDSLINSQHSKQLFNQFRGKNKCLLQVDGDHNSLRTKQLVKKVFEQIGKIVDNTYDSGPQTEELIIR